MDVRQRLTMLRDDLAYDWSLKYPRTVCGDFELRRATQVIKKRNLDRAVHLSAMFRAENILIGIRNLRDVGV